MSQPGNDDHTADQWHMHARIIRDLIAMWENGEITMHAKRRQIADENMRYHGTDCSRALTRVTGPSPETRDWL
jgi:hypothetical protein